MRNEDSTSQPPQTHPPSNERWSLRVHLFYNPEALGASNKDKLVGFSTGMQRTVLKSRIQIPPPCFSV